MARPRTRLSIIMPVYNEEGTVSAVLKKVKALRMPGIEKEIVVVDDGSTDSTPSILSRQSGIKLFTHRKNQGKGAAVRTGLKESTGSVVIIQDADMEYCPDDIASCIAPIVAGRAKVVYGSRWLGRKCPKGMFSLGGLTITKATNLFFGSRLTDQPTCYKTFDARLLRSFPIKSNGFEWEVEITAKILRKGIKIHEVPIRYSPRKEGKKITYWDGFRIIAALLRYRFFG